MQYNAYVVVVETLFPLKPPSHNLTHKSSCIVVVVELG